jgi:hypothetical protein
MRGEETSMAGGDVYIFFFIKGGTNSVILVLLVPRTRMQDEICTLLKFSI